MFSSSSRALAPLLPGGHLPASSLRTLVDLHHTASTFITPSSLSEIVSSTFSQTIVKSAGDDTLRDAAARQLERGGTPGQKTDTLVQLAQQGSGQTLKGSRSISDERLLGFSHPSLPSRSPTAVSLFRKNNPNKSLPWSDLRNTDPNNSSGTYSNAVSRKTAPIGRGMDAPDRLVVMREIIREDALWGTVQGSRPGLEAVLEYREGQAEGAQEKKRENE
jgi:hypothetical protein